ncbi:NAD(P)/FAD-dependent oxidoreductase [Terrihabitans sp. B22-R8]|uniref:NAD(P)/FAD-dependent oxidoreductase n=1 Tax=Terrihabitans sp. B22-R8 TaxID=3425128 RepID=UPI00403C5E50
MTDTFYELSAPPLPAFPPLSTNQRVEICVIGAGFTGLGAALKLAESGRSVMLLDQGRVGQGASGRNGGQIHTGLRRDQIFLENKFGPEAARQLWDLSQSAVAHLDAWIARYDIDCDRRNGMIYADHRARLVSSSHDYVHHLRSHYAYGKAESLSREAIRELVRSDDYHGGMLDRGGGHLHPLKYARGLAKAAAGLGVVIHEQSKALAIEPGSPAKVRTSGGTVTADWVVVAGDSLMQGLVPDADTRILPIASTVAITEKLGERLRDFLTSDMAVADSRFVVNYFRPTADGRLLFGGGESYSNTHVADPEKLVRSASTAVFPALKDVRFDHAWSGIVGITVSRLPLIRLAQPNVLLAAGYSGQGVALAPFTGAVLADVILGNAQCFEVLARLPSSPFPGGKALRHPLMVLAMLYYAARDRM